MGSWLTIALTAISTSKAPKDRTGTHNRERLVDGRLRSTEGPIITSKWRARTAVEGAEVLTSDSEYEH